MESRWKNEWNVYLKECQQCAPSHFVCCFKTFYWECENCPLFQIPLIYKHFFLIYFCTLTFCKMTQFCTPVKGILLVSLFSFLEKNVNLPYSTSFSTVFWSSCCYHDHNVFKDGGIVEMTQPFLFITYKCTWQHIHKLTNSISSITEPSLTTSSKAPSKHQ